MLREQRPSHNEIYFPPIVGPLKIRYFDVRPRPDCKLEAHCHRCNWTFFFATEAECKDRLQLHIWREHFGMKAVSNNALRPPGR
jgi:hypothetical protein